MGTSFLRQAQEGLWAVQGLLKDTTPQHDPAGLEESAVEHLSATLHRRVRIGRGTVVHGLTTHMWAGVEVPAPACHAAVDPLRLHAAEGPVTCRRCLGRSRADREQVPGQTALL